MNFKEWLYSEYEADLDYDVSDPNSIKLPTRRTLLHRVAGDAMDGFGNIFSKRMGAGMPSKAGEFTTKDPIQTFNDGQYLVVVVDEPYDPNNHDASDQNLRKLMNQAIKKIENDQETAQAFIASRAAIYNYSEKGRNAETKYIVRDGQHFIRFTFRFKMNVTPGHNYSMSDPIRRMNDDRDGNKSNWDIN